MDGQVRETYLIPAVWWWHQVGLSAVLYEARLETRVCQNIEHTVHLRHAVARHVAWNAEDLVLAAVRFERAKKFPSPFPHGAFRGAQQGVDADECSNACIRTVDRIPRIHSAPGEIVAGAVIAHLVAHQLWRTEWVDPVCRAETSVEQSCHEKDPRCLRNVEKLGASLTCR